MASALSSGRWQGRRRRGLRLRLRRRGTAVLKSGTTGVLVVKSRAAASSASSGGAVTTSMSSSGRSAAGSMAQLSASRTVVGSGTAHAMLAPAPSSRRSGGDDDGGGAAEWRASLKSPAAWMVPLKRRSLWTALPAWAATSATENGGWYRGEPADRRPPIAISSSPRTLGQKRRKKASWASSPR